MRSLIVNSAKGGVGKSTIVENIAIKLRELGEKVVILDLDVTTSNIPSIKGIEVVNTGLNIQSTKSKIKKMIRRTIKKYDKKYDWLIIDTPPTINETLFAISEVIKDVQILYVTTGSKNSIKDTGVGIRFFTDKGFRPLGLIQNMISSIFGNSFDSEKEYGVKTIAEIPLVESSNISKYFDWVYDLNEIIDDNIIKFEEEKLNIISKITLEELKESMLTDKKFELKFYNFETWDYIKDQIIDKISSSPFENIINSEKVISYSVEKLKSIYRLGDVCSVMYRGLPYGLEYDLIPFEIQEAKIVWGCKPSYGLPMFELASGQRLFLHEVSIMNDIDIKDVVDNGAHDMGDGRIVQSLYATLYYTRLFLRMDIIHEFVIIKKFIEEVSTTYNDIDFIRKIIYTLEGYDDYDSLLQDIISGGKYNENFIKYLKDIHSYFGLNFDDVE